MQSPRSSHKPSLLPLQSAPVNGTVSRFHTPIEAKGRVYLATTSQLAGFSVGAGSAAFSGERVSLWITQVIRKVPRFRRLCPVVFTVIFTGTVPSASCPAAQLAEGGASYGMGLLQGRRPRAPSR